MDSQMIQQEQKIDIEMIQTINQLDKQIKSLYEKIQQISVKSNPNLTDQTKILKEIEQLEALKEDLYTNIGDNYASTQANIVQSKADLANEVAVGNIVKNQLKNSNKNLKILNNQRYNNLRMAEINDYYSDKYSTQTKIMKTIVYFCIPILILGILMKKEFIPTNIALAIIGLLSGICIFIVIMQSIDISSRSNMVFSEYNFESNPDELASEAGSGNGSQPQQLDMTLNCAGEACCPTGNNFGTTWDSTNKQCVTPDYLDKNSEGFVGERCLQNSFNKSDFNINVFQNTNSVTGYSENQEDYAKF
jgi:hypothetical protein